MGELMYIYTVLLHIKRITHHIIPNMTILTIIIVMTIIFQKLPLLHLLLKASGRHDAVRDVGRFAAALGGEKQETPVGRDRSLIILVFYLITEV